MDKQNKIFIVTASFGSWDEYSERNIKAFKNKEDALSYSKKYERIIGKLSNWVYECSSGLHNSSSEEFFGTFGYKIWVKYHLYFEEFNNCKIETLELM